MANVGSILEISEGRYENEFKIERSGTFAAGQWTLPAGATKFTITLDSGASGVDSYYVGMFVHLVGGGSYEPKILAYNGTTKVAELGTWTGNRYDSSVAPTGNNVPATGKQWQIIGDFPIYREFSWTKDGVDIPGAVGTSYTPSQPGVYRFKEVATFPKKVNVADTFGPTTFGPKTTVVSDPITVIGTRDPALVYQEDLRYLGCFTCPEWTTAADGSFSYSVGYAYTGVMSFNAAGNGGAGSLFMRTHAYDQRVGEFTIPPQSTWATTSTQTPPAGTFIQTPKDAIEGQLATSGIVGGGGIMMSGLHVQGNYLYVAAHELYDTGNGGSASWVWRRPLNLSATGAVEGPYHVTDYTKEAGVGAQWSQQNNPRRFAGYFASVPASLRVKLGGEMILGCSAQSIVSNTSDGPAIASVPNLNDFGGRTGRRGTVTASGFSNNSLTLDGGSSSVTDFYVDWYILCRSETNPNITGMRRVTAYNGTTKVATVASNWSANPAAGNQWLIAPHVEANAMSMYGSGELQALNDMGAPSEQTYKYQGVFNWTCRRMGGYAIPDGTRSVLTFGKAGNGLYKYTIGGMAADGFIYFDVTGNGGTPGERAGPYYARCWAYDANELEQVRLGNVAVNKVRPYAVLNFQFPFAGGPSVSTEVTGVTYDPATRRVFLATNGLPYGGTCVHVYEIANAVSTNTSTVPNTMTLSLPTGTATNYPYQFGRVFSEGSIQNYPQVLVDGVALTTQADIKNRWPDGSVKFAVISVVLPTLNTTNKTITFQNQASGNNTPVTVASMLGAPYNFNCTINATSGGTSLSGAPVSARAILSALSDATLASNTTNDSPNSRYWTQGSVCTTVILADHTTKAYDFGTNATYKSLRPIFHVQFWPSLNKYKVRVVVEASDVTKLADQSYDVSLSIDNTSPTTVFSQNAIPHALGTRWSRTFWSGTAPVALNHDHNCEYVASTYIIPRFDMAQVWPESKIATQYSNWTSIPSTDKGLYKNGNPGKGLGYSLSMQAPGGRPEIAILAEWGINALMKGDYRLHEISERMAEFSLAWPSCFREGDATKKFYDSAALSNFSTNFPGITFPTSSSVAGSAMGCPTTVFARPTNFLNDGNQYMNNSSITAADRYDFAPPIAANASIPTNDGGWKVFEDHIPQPYYIPYMMSGDYFWLEQMQFWAARAVFDPQANTNASIYPRGASLYGGNLVGSIRRMAWAFRNRVSAAVFSVDGSKEKVYYNYLIEDAMQCLEGMMGVTGSGRESTTSYVWGTGNGRTGRFNGKGISPLHSYEYGVEWGYGYDGDVFEPTVSNGGINRFRVGICQGPFQMGYMLIALTFAKDNGYNVAKIREWTAYYLTEATKSDNTAQLLALLPMPALYGSYPALGGIYVNSGGNYSVAPTGVTIGPPNSAAGGAIYNTVPQVQATASITMNGNAVSAVTLTNLPSGYRSPPTVTLTGGTGTPASVAPYNGPLTVTTWIPTWQAAFDEFVDPTLPKRIADSRINGATWGTGIFGAAAAQLTDVPDGQQAYDWIKRNWLDTRATSVLPWVAGWSIAPR